MSFSSNDNSPSGYYAQAKDAAARGDYEGAEQICRDALDQFEHAGANRKASKACHLLGELAYQKEDLESAEIWYRRALSIDERIGDDEQLGYAATCNNLGSVANAMGKYDAAEEWLYKSIRIKEALGDQRGVATSYHQLGVVAESRLDLKTAERWYLKSLTIAEEQKDMQGMVLTPFNLARIAGKNADKKASSDWQRKALQALENEGRSSTAISLGEVAERGGDFEAAKIIYQKALNIARRLGDKEGQSLSAARLNNLALLNDVAWHARLTAFACLWYIRVRSTLSKKASDMSTKEEP